MSKEALKKYLDGLDPVTRKVAKEALRLQLYRASPEAWARLKLGITLDLWQRKLVEAPPGKQVIALTARQRGKTEAASIAIAHEMIFGTPGSTSLFLCPTQRQSQEGVRRTRKHLVKGGAKLKSDNTFSLEVENGSRALALPGSSDEGIRGLSINGILCLDEAARISDDLYEAVRPMLIRYSGIARLFLLSTAWSQEGFFYKVWTEGTDDDWIKIRADIYDSPHMTPDDIARERKAMGETAFHREMECEFGQTNSSFFDPEALARMWGTDAVTVEGNADPVVVTRPMFGSLFKETAI